MKPFSATLFFALLLPSVTWADGPVRTRGDTKCESASDVARFKGLTVESFLSLRERLDGLLKQCEAAAEAVLVISESIANLEEERRNLDRWWQQEAKFREQLARARAEPLGNRDAELRASSMRRNAERTNAVIREIEALKVKLSESEAACKRRLNANVGAEMLEFQGSLTAASRCIDHRLKLEGIK